MSDGWADRGVAATRRRVDAGDASSDVRVPLPGERTRNVRRPNYRWLTASVVWS